MNHNSLAVIVGLRAGTNALMNLSCTFSGIARASHVLQTDNWASDAERSKVPMLVQTNLVAVDRC